ncbi:Hypothetical protein R9X50_00644800 [Acrodontium crateriforme]|uniref:Uncharacterized protein n=1 Tax=Acrodontium crateriforme TaxID=150365 RepID=A0AAQ3M7W8_9PEZI|nr:Hypothetical protein R9X50_00644800 [Acrodontium crateriforme]
MDKAKGIAKNGWHPSWDKKISRDTWKSDLIGMAPGAKKKDPYADQKNHQSTPLSSLRDPASFGPPPKSTTYYGDSANASSTPTSATQAMPATRAVPTAPSASVNRPVPTPKATKPTTGGWGAPVPVSTRKPEQEQEAEEPPAPPQPYRVDTSGLRTDHLPKPPLRRTIGETPPPASAGRGPPPGLPSRQTPSLPARQTPPLPARGTVPPPVLPPRQNEYPDEYTPAPPPPYSALSDTGAVNTATASRLAQAGVQVPGLEIGAQSAQPIQPGRPSVPVGHGDQISELQQRFARMGSGGAQNAPAASSARFGGHPSAAIAAAAKKPPPPPPVKKPALSTTNHPSADNGVPAPRANGGPAPPPLPLATKPRPA